jgi:hypothetical protein
MRCKHCCKKLSELPVKIKVKSGRDTYYDPRFFHVCENCAADDRYYMRRPKRRMLEQYGVFSYWINDARYMTLEEVVENYKPESRASLSFCLNSASWGRGIVTADTMEEFQTLLDEELPFSYVPTEEWRERETSILDDKESTLKKRRTELVSLVIPESE